MIRIRFGIGNESSDSSVAGFSNPDASFPTWVVLRPRLGVSHIDNVVLVDEDPAGPPKLLPLCDESSILIENLDTVIGAITHEDPSLGVHGDSVRGIKLARSAPFLAPRLDELSSLGKLYDAGIAVSTMPVGYEDVPIGSHYYIRWLIERVHAVAGYSRFAKRHQQFAFRTKLEDLVPVPIFALSIGNPYIAFF